MAGKHLQLSSPTRTKLAKIDVAFNLIRHITRPSVEDYVQQVLSEARRGEGGGARFPHVGVQTTMKGKGNDKDMPCDGT